MSAIKRSPLSAMITIAVIIATVVVTRTASARPGTPDGTIELHRPAGVGPEWPAVGDEVTFDVSINRGSRNSKRLSIRVECTSGERLVHDVNVPVGTAVPLDGAGGDGAWTDEPAVCVATLLFAGDETSMLDSTSFAVSEPVGPPPSSTTTTTTTSTTTTSTTSTTTTSTTTTSTTSTTTTTPPPAPETGPAVGFGALATGGEVICEVTTLADNGPGSLRACAEAGGNYVTFAVSGTIDVDHDDIDVASDTTIDGAGRNVTIIGMFDIKEVRNVIVRNLTFVGSRKDAIRVLRSDTMWFDHLDLSGAGDGLIDITRGSTDVTISWSHFHHHDKMVLINPGTTSGIRAHVTLHHNWFDHGGRRYPSTETSDVHAFNNFYDGWSTYAISATEGARFVSENSVYVESGDEDAILTTRSGEAPGEAKSIGDVFVGEMQLQLRGDTFVPPYAYSIDTVDSVVGAVTTGTGPNH